jgi:hypothetical protein
VQALLVVVSSEGRPLLERVHGGGMEAESSSYVPISSVIKVFKSSTILAVRGIEAATDEVTQSTRGVSINGTIRTRILLSN